MPDPNLHKSLYGTLCTVIFGTITKITANEISAFFTCFAGFSTGIYGLVKTYEWWEKRRRVNRYNHRKKDPQ